jgi:Rod binding domain-containing protein
MDALPIIGPAAIPAGVTDTKAYRAALGFERELLSQLAKQMTATARGDEDGETAASSAYKDMLPDALADSMIHGGGTGIAMGVYRSIER